MSALMTLPRALDSPILLVSSDTLPKVVTSYLHANVARVSNSALIGGASAVTESVRSTLEATLNGF